jgi:hypothetical protein
MRGEDVAGDETIDDAILEIPLCIQVWEPRYALATYRAREADFPSPSVPDLSEVDPGGSPNGAEGGDVGESLAVLGRVWADQSNGECSTTAVEGGAEAAIALLARNGFRQAEVGADVALAHMAWAAASGGAHGRRPGSPSGRFAAWWVVAAVAGLEWPVDPDALGAEARRLRWILWEPHGLASGWGLHLAVSDPAAGRAWAVAATDSHREEPDPQEGG